jgi:UDP-glucose 4-epimerase
MTILVTGSSGHLGEALVRTLRDGSRSVVGLDIQPSPFTDIVASITDAAVVTNAMRDVEAVLHTATLHEPHVGQCPQLVGRRRTP